MSDNEIFVYDTAKASTVKKEPTSLKLVNPDSPILRQKLEEFDFTNPPVNPNELASALVEVCQKLNGLGLSANQCGLPYRVFVMGSNENYIACFNPKLISTEGEAHLPEGCLSFPLLQLNITRPKQVTVEYQDWNGEKHTATFSGITARCFLHELDHMNGIVYTDRVKPLALQFGLKKMNKMREKYFKSQVMKQVIHGQQKTNP